MTNHIKVPGIVLLDKRIALGQPWDAQTGLVIAK